MKRVAYGFAIALVIFLLLLLYTNSRPAQSVESRKADTNEVVRTNR